MRGTASDLGNALIDACIVEANLLDLLRAARVLEQQIILGVHLRAAVRKFARGAHGRMLVVFGATSGALLLRHVHVAVREATFQDHRPALPVVVALVVDWCAATRHFVLVGYLRVALVHLVWLQHVVNAAAERYLSVGFLYAV